MNKESWIVLNNLSVICREESPEAVHRKPIGSESKLWTVNIKIQLFKILKAKNINGREIYPAPVMFQALVKLHIITLPLEFWSLLIHPTILPMYESFHSPDLSGSLVSIQFYLSSTLCSTLPIFHCFIQISILEEPFKSPSHLKARNTNSTLHPPPSYLYQL